MNTIYEQTILKSLNKYKGLYESFITITNNEDKKNLANIIKNCIDSINKIYTSDVYDNEFIEKTDRFANYIKTITDLDKKTENKTSIVYITNILASQSNIATLSNYENELAKSIPEEKSL